jgi:2-succinyl-5-enolpyruvyl-6-hydroxy-3-cyclohexene-1-carboxylate synthase
MPDGAALYAANSMVVRDIDSFAVPRAASLRLLANRGVNGIDGLVSAALGAAVAGHRPTVLWCGDLALLHDVSGLLAGRLQDADLTIIVSNDEGGGIFEYLAVAQTVPRSLFERVFAVPHGVDLCEVARGFGWNAVRATTGEAFAKALSHALAGGRHVIEVPVDRASNTAFHRSLQERVRAALRQESLA